MEFSQLEEDMRDFDMAESGKNTNMNGWKQSGKRRESDTEEKLTRLISGLVNLTHSEATAVSLMGVLKQINLATVHGSKEPRQSP